MKHFLVTGGCGFIGSYLVEALVSAGNGVRILDDLSTGTLNYKPPGVELVTGDVADAELVVEAMLGMHGCFHLAAVASVERGNKDWVGSHRTNVTGTVAVFDAARKCTVPVVYASSASVYGDNPDILSEEAIPRPLSAYGADKYGSELHGYVASHVHGVANCGLRFFNVYGPRQDPRSPYSGVITIFNTRMQREQPITINGDGYHSRDFIYVGDVVRALQRAMEYCSAAETATVFNVCTGADTNVLDLAEHMASVLRHRPEIIFGPARPGDPRRSVGCPNRARQVLGFEALTDLATGLAMTLTSESAFA